MSNPHNAPTATNSQTGGGPRDMNAPNPTGGDAKDVGGKVAKGPNEGGTDTNPNAKKDPVANVVDKNSPEALQSPSKKEADAAADAIVKTEEKDEQGNTIVRSATTQETLDEAKKREATAPGATNETQRMTGVPGNVNLTQNGTLNSDKSLRDPRSVEELNELLNKTTGPNPAPLRDGNELLKASNGITPAAVVAINTNTNAIAEELVRMADAGTISDEDRNKLREFGEQLRSTGNFQ